MNRELRTLDAEIATKLFGLNVVANDWPCGYLISEVFLNLEWRDDAWLRYGTRKPVRIQAPTAEQSICLAALEWIREI